MQCVLRTHLAFDCTSAFYRGHVSRLTHGWHLCGSQHQKRLHEHPNPRARVHPMERRVEHRWSLVASQKREAEVLPPARSPAFATLTMNNVPIPYSFK